MRKTKKIRTKRKVRRTTNRRRRGGSPYNDDEGVFEMSVDNSKYSDSSGTMYSSDSSDANSSRMSVSELAITPPLTPEYSQNDKTNEPFYELNKLSMTKTENQHPVVNNSEYTEKMLKMMCSEGGICLDFGDKANIIKDYYENFDFKYAMRGERIGAPSNNGAVVKIPFHKNGYITQTALKLATSSEADNLCYEYEVGSKFINKYVKIFPCFTETYGRLLKFSSNKEHKYVIGKLSKKQPVSIANGMFQDAEFNMDDACVNNHLYAVLIQYFDGFTTMFETISNKELGRDLGDEIPTLFYQGYFALAALRKTFTHFDLHAGNFGFYKPYKTKYLIMTYHGEDGKTYSFPTRHIAKIIDYGRCHFYIDDNSNTPAIIDRICELKSCGKHKCGENNGFKVIAGCYGETASSPTSCFYWVNPLNKNESHDLRAYANYEAYFQKYFNIGSVIYKDTFGTPEDLTEDYGKIKNVNDMKNGLERFIETNQDLYKHTEEKFKQSGLTKAGTLHVYYDMRPYEWILE